MIIGVFDVIDFNSILVYFLWFDVKIDILVVWNYLFSLVWDSVFKNSMWFVMFSFLVCLWSFLRLGLLFVMVSVILGSIGNVLIIKWWFLCLISYFIDIIRYLVFSFCFFLSVICFLLLLGVNSVKLMLLCIIDICLLGIFSCFILFFNVWYMFIICVVCWKMWCSILWVLGYDGIRLIFVFCVVYVNGKVNVLVVCCIVMLFGKK